VNEPLTPLDPILLLDSYAHVPDHVVFRSFVAETVVLNLQTGKYHGLNPTGGRMLEVLDGGQTPREAADRLAGEFARPVEEIQADLLEFVGDLHGRGLLSIATEKRA